MFWKVLFWVYGILYLFIIVASSLEVKWKPVDWISEIAIIAGLFLFYAYAYKKKYFSKTTRTIIVVAALTYRVAYALYLDHHYGAFPGSGLGDAVFNMVVVLPVFIPAILYARKTGT